jgi:hypothetical protein
VLFYCPDKFVYNLWESFENVGNFWFGSGFYNALNDRVDKICYLWSPEYFVESCQDGKLKEVQNYIECGVVTDCTEGLISAIKSQKCDVIELLLKKDKVLNKLGEDNVKVWDALLKHFDDYHEFSPVFKVVRKYKPDLADSVNWQIEEELMRAACDITGSEFDSDEFVGGDYEFV